jgi:hypothetical protein
VTTPCWFEYLAGERLGRLLRRRTREQDVEFEPGFLVVHVGDVPLDDAALLQFLDAVPDRAWRDADGVRYLRRRRIPGILLEQVQDAAVRRV